MTYPGQNRVILYETVYLEPMFQCRRPNDEANKPRNVLGNNYLLRIYFKLNYAFRSCCLNALAWELEKLEFFQDNSRSWLQKKPQFKKMGISIITTFLLTQYPYMMVVSLSLLAVSLGCAGFVMNDIVFHCVPQDVTRC